MDKIFESVKLFNTTGGQEVRSFDTLEVDIPEREFRFKLIQEEVNELVYDGFKRKNLVEVIDACGDIVYVVVGASLSHGIPFEIRKNKPTEIPSDFDPSLTCEHARNFAKLAHEKLMELYRITCMSDLKDPEVIALLRSEIPELWADIVELCYCISTSYGVDLDGVLEEIQSSNMSKFGPNLEVYRREDGKVLKGPNYFKPNIARVMREQGVLV